LKGVKDSYISFERDMSLTTHNQEPTYPLPKHSLQSSGTQGFISSTMQFLLPLHNLLVKLTAFACVTKKHDDYLLTTVLYKKNDRSLNLTGHDYSLTTLKRNPHANYT